jgi:transcriptional regulator GlxA family with amidase domain
VIRVADPAIDAAGLRRPDARRWLSAGPASRLAAGLLAEVRRGDDASPISVDLLATELLAFLEGQGGREPRAAPPWLERVRERLRDDPRRVPSLGDLAADAGVSRAHLARAFRARTGHTVGSYLRRLRVERARGLIAGTDLPLSRVAFEAGFADQSHMHRLVVELLGLTPGTLRERARGDATPVQDARRRPAAS